MLTKMVVSLTRQSMMTRTLMKMSSMTLLISKAELLFQRHCVNGQDLIETLLSQAPTLGLKFGTRLPGISTWLFRNQALPYQMKTFCHDRFFFSISLITAVYQKYPLGALQIFMDYGYFYRECGFALPQNSHKHSQDV